MRGPLRFCFGLHLHQPVGNFDSVFTEHVELVYRPLFTRLASHELGPVAVHISGPLLDWLDGAARDVVDLIGEQVDAGRIELMAAGHDEPILAVLTRDDRIEQIDRHRRRLASRFGVEVDGMWLTERVWEPDLPGDLAAAGIRWTVVDDRHFLSSGFDRSELHRPWVTEFDDQRIHLLAIDQKLRYLVPFRQPEELADYLGELRDAGHQLAVLADDGEKFGGWPGTADWVWRDGWFTRFAETMHSLRRDGIATLSRFGDAVDMIPSSGPAYLPSASYAEMEGWALPPERARRLHAAGEEDGTALFRGGHWRHFLHKYPEANRLHKAVQEHSAFARRSGDPIAIRRHIGRAQCNDAYWHGIFGGIYLPFLRSALWAELAAAARMLRQGEPLRTDKRDVDADGNDEIRITSENIYALISPARGAALEICLDTVAGINLADVVSRHEESYHPPAATADEVIDTADDSDSAPSEGTASIHDLESMLTIRPPLDRETRALFIDRIIAGDTDVGDFAAGTVEPLRSWAGERFDASGNASGERVVVRCVGRGLRKRYVFHPNRTIDVDWEWDLPDDAGDSWFTTELSLAAVPVIDAPEAERWEYPIVTVSKREQGFEETLQGTAVIYRWPLTAGRARLTVRPL